MSANSSRIPLIYILSTGRSGSTLLGLMLNGFEGVWSLGEIHVLRHELERSRFPCGCGSHLTECPFWSRVLSDLPLSGRISVDYFRETYSAGRVIRCHHVRDVLTRSVASRRRAEADRFGEVNASILGRIRSAAQAHSGTEVEFLVDASKDVYRLFWLQASDRFDLHVIHLVKDPRGFVYANLKDRPSRPFRKALRMSGRWTVQNVLMRHVGCPDPDRYWLMRYEDLARKPRTALDELASWLGLESRERSHFRDAENHAISGNEMRWGHSDVRFDDAWCRELPLSYSWAVWFSTAPAAYSLGYRMIPYWTRDRNPA